MFGGFELENIFVKLINQFLSEQRNNLPAKAFLSEHRASLRLKAICTHEKYILKIHT